MTGAIKDVLRIVLTLAAIVGLVWLYLTLISNLDQWFNQEFGVSLRRRRGPKSEIQTLFHGNTKDQDQI